MLTSHGHHIPNTPEDTKEGQLNPEPVNCGGPGICRRCTEEVLYGMRETKTAKYDIPMIAPDRLRPEEKARFIVAQYFNARISEDSAVEQLRLADTTVVWFCYILGGWKCLVITNIPDGMYCEVTYNAANKETYLDVYVKYHNMAIPDGGA